MIMKTIIKVFVVILTLAIFSTTVLAQAEADENTIYKKKTIIDIKNGTVIEGETQGPDGDWIPGGCPLPTKGSLIRIRTSFRTKVLQSVIGI
jgi:hypothetical protein